MVWLSTVVFGVLLAVGARIYQHYNFALNSNRVVHPHQPGKCHLVPLLARGAEDLTMVPGTSFALVSAGLIAPFALNRTAKSRTEREVEVDNSQRGLFLFDFARPEAAPTKMKLVNFGPDETANFNPHGVSIHHSPTHMLAYVVNHHQRPDSVGGLSERVEKFEVNVTTRTLTHVKTITHDSFHFVNNLYVVAEDKFYFTNFFLHANHAYLKYGVPVQAIFGLPTGSVVYFDGQNTVTAAKYLTMPNGVAVSKTRSTGKRIVYVTESFSGYLHTYEVADEEGRLRLIAKNFTGYPVMDNIVIDELGHLVIGGTVNGYAMYKWFGLFPNHRAESMVFKVRLDDNTGVPSSYREVLVDDGALIDGASVGLTYQGNAVLVGTPHERLLYCRCDSPC